MKKKIGDYDIPFDMNGNQLDYLNTAWPGGGNVWTKNYEFEDVLRLEGFSRGRSSVKFDFRRSNGKTVSFFVKDFCDLIKSLSCVQFGVFQGKFTFTKKGINYGCKLVEGEGGF